MNKLLLVIALKVAVTAVATSMLDPKTIVYKEDANRTIEKNQTIEVTNSTIEKNQTQPKNDYWNSYRIGDGLKDPRHTPGCERFPGSLVCEYRKKTRRINDIPTLISVLEQGKFGEKPQDNEVVAHLRLGDGLCAPNHNVTKCFNHAEKGTEPDCWNNVRDCFKSSIGQLYAFPNEFYAEIPNLLEQKAQVVLVYDEKHWTRMADPRGGNYSIDYRYADNDAALFEKHGFEVRRRQPRNPDDDFYFLCSARTFIKGGGGYSDLVASIVQAWGGTVIIPNAEGGTVLVNGTSLKF